MISLERLVAACANAGDLDPKFSGDGNLQIAGIAYDSRAVRPGYLFVALRGKNADGHDYLASAIESGATAVLVDNDWTGELPSTAVVRVADTRKALPYVSASFYDNPSSSFDLTGVTGTNGKTTTTYMLASIFRAAGFRTAVVGTVGVQIDGESVDTHWTVSTTPESLDLQALFADFRDQGVQKVVMEVTSIAVDQERTACCAFDAMLFTNLTQDHLDYHGTMDEYRRAKGRLFGEYAIKYAKPGYRCVINVDDSYGRGYADEARASGASVTTYGVDSADAELAAQAIESLPSGTSFHAYERASGSRAYPISLGMGGLFNVYNALASIGAARGHGIEIETVQHGLATMASVPGRFEPVPTGNRGFHVLVDYAHTPDGLDNVLRSARALKPARLLTVFGCGGNRDARKRPIMGKIAVDLADRVIVTSDNPRNEQPDAIIADILAGIPDGVENDKVVVEADRRAAIQIALCREAQPGDLVVIAGKGHETYQIVGSEVLPFDDRKVAVEVMAECE